MASTGKRRVEAEEAQDEWLSALICTHQKKGEMHVYMVTEELEAKSEGQAVHREFAAEDPDYNMWRLHHSLNSPGKSHLPAQPQAMTTVPQSPQWPGKEQV